jgi:two-component system, LytTR family, sensor kinase
MKTRYGDTLNLQIEVDKQYNHYMLPSLSLQMLVENAVKHNSLSRNSPLNIEIFTTAGNKLVVNNNLQRKNINGQSNKIGLQNIRSKYELLRSNGFQVIEEGNNYTVVLPLIWNNKMEPGKTLSGKIIE